MPAKRANPLRNRLDDDLNETEMDQLKEQFVIYLAENEIDPTNQSINKELVTALINMMLNVNKEWTGLPTVSIIWDKGAIDHLKSHLRNQKRYQCQPLMQKIKEYKEANRSETASEDNQIKDQEDRVSQSIAPPKSKLGKRAASKSIEASIADATPTKEPMTVLKIVEPESDAAKFDQMINKLTTVQRAVIDRELRIHLLETSIAHHKHEL